jgi:chemotaxis family two-component system sensor histidine kinase/response regulator PixL
MAINSDIRDQAYQFFIEEAPELLQVIEAGLLTLRQEHSTAKVHNLMRAAHSIKGGAASVCLEGIATLAHRLENIFKALYSETLEIDTDLESQLLQAYDCLRLPLMEQLMAGSFDVEQALSVAEPIFTQLEERFGDALSQGESYIPSSAELGFDMTKSIFEVDVADGLERLAAILDHPSDYEVVGELRAQAEVFAGFAELLNQPEFGAIASTTLRALDAHPDRVLEITQLALTDFQIARQAVLASKGQAASTSVTAAISPCATLVALADLTASSLPDFSAIPAIESMTDLESIVEDTEDTIPLLEDIFGSFIATPDTDRQELGTAAEMAREAQTTDTDEERELQETFSTWQNYVCDDPVISSEAGTDALDSSIIDVEWVANATFMTEESAGEIPLLEEIFGSAIATPETEAEEELNEGLKVGKLNVEDSDESSNLTLEDSLPLCYQPSPPPQPSTFETLEVAVQSIEQLFDSLPPIQALPTPTSQLNSANSTAASKGGSLVPAPQSLNEIVERRQAAELTNSPRNELNQTSTDIRQGEAPVASNLSVRVDSERLGRMNNLVGELAINRNGLSLQNDQLQGSVRDLLNRFSRVQNMVGELRRLSDQMLVAPLRHNDEKLPTSVGQLGEIASARADFDALELDSYGALHSRLQGLLEDMMQLEESVDDIVLFARQSDQTLEQQRQMLTQLRDELMWARMLPLGEVLHRFPRMLRDLSTTYKKPVSLQLSGTNVLVDKAVLEKLYDPLLHLLRNAFDHGIEFPKERRQKGKPEQGQIEIRAYHRGSQTIIEMKDDGQGLNVERIGRLAVEQGFLSREQLVTISNNQLFELVFEPGFSTASQVSELSGRGVGLDVVRSQLRSLKGTISVTSSAGVGTTFTLRLPLTLTIAKLLVCFIGTSALALPSDSIEEIVNPKAEQIKQTGTQRFLHWRGQLVPTYRLADLLHYACPLGETSPSRALFSVPSPENWAPPMLVLSQGQNFLALEIDRLVTEQELVIKPFGSAIAPPSCTYGCTILGDGSLIPVIDATVLLDQLLGQSTTATATKTEFSPRSAIKKQLPEGSIANENSPFIKTTPAIKTIKAPTVLVVDDAAALRRTLALTLERSGCQVLQARDGREAIEQLQRSSSVSLVICDIEMPNMNGFEFLSHRRQDSQISKTPVVMLTSRSNDKHRWLAMQLGATAYFTKPYLEQEFLGAIKQIIDQSKPESLPALQPTY